MGDEGFEPTPIFPKKSKKSRKRAAKSGADSDKLQNNRDALDFQKVIQAWPNLKRHLKLAILALVNGGTSDI